MSDNRIEDRILGNGSDGTGEGRANARLKARITTQPVSAAQPILVDISSLLTRVPSDALGLFVLESEDLVLVERAQKITLGRDMGIDGALVSIDLTPHRGTPLGVSRQHAEILLSQDVYSLQDLGSTNGTWINEIRVPPRIARTLKNGDMIRLGQVKAYVVFHDPGAGQVSEVNGSSAS